VIRIVKKNVGNKLADFFSFCDLQLKIMLNDGRFEGAPPRSQSYPQP
jgi:hypothetical protein